MIDKCLMHKTCDSELEFAYNANEKIEESVLLKVQIERCKKYGMFYRMYIKQECKHCPELDAENQIVGDCVGPSNCRWFNENYFCTHMNDDFKRGDMREGYINVFVAASRKYRYSFVLHYKDINEVYKFKLSNRVKEFIQEKIANDFYR